MQKVFETILGAIVLCVAAFFLLFAYKTADIRSNKDDYPLSAKFESAAGIGVGSDVKIAGVKIGQVVKETLDINNFLAIISMEIAKDIKLPEDSSAKIVSEGLMGDKYIEISPGSSDHTIASGGTIQYTQSSVSLESLISKMIFGK